MRTNVFRISILLVLAAQLSATELSQKVIRATRTDTLPLLDGAVTEPVWQTTQPILDFTQGEPVEGGRPTELTSVRILYNDRAIYIGVICYDAEPAGIVRQLSRRDRTTEADRFTVLIDSYFDRKSAFVFTVNVSGVQSDGVLSQEGSVYDLSWDAVWDVKTRVYLDGWSAEFEIPFNVLRFSENSQSESIWGVNFRRYISRRKEMDEWIMVPRTDRYEIPKWGTLQGIRSIQPPLNLAFSPYVSGSSTIESGSTAGQSTNMFRGGLDVKYGLARNLTLDATINPDFGQVEVDQAVMNLTVFETLYPEKRPFFVEGAQFFTFGSGYDNTPLPLFFSRRVGKRPSFSALVSAPPGGSIEKNPLRTTILGAAKFSGRSSSGLSVGALTALTDQEEATLRDAGGGEFTQRTEPAGSYNVVRLRQEFEGGSWLGGIATLAGKESVRPALSGGVDWNLHFAEGTHSLDGYLAGARAWSGDDERSGGAGRLLLSRIAGSRWSYLAGYDFFSKNFSINDVGFFARPHDQGGYVQLLYRVLTPDGAFLRYGGSVIPEARWNWNGVPTTRQIEANAFGTFTNFWTVQLLINYRFSAYDDEERGILGTYLRPAATALTAQVTTDERRDVVLTAVGSAESDERQKSQLLVSGSLTIRPTSWIELTPSTLYLRVRGEEAAAIRNGAVGVDSVGGVPHSLFGDRDLDEVDLNLRGTLTFTHTLSLQFYTQLLIARGKYDNYRPLISSTEFGGVVIPTVGFDFNQAVFNANLLLRWEYMPGSALYLVWTQSRFGDSGVYDSGFGARFRETFRALPHEDVLFLKLSYWLPL
jgi:hypothetical protein